MTKVLYYPLPLSSFSFFPKQVAMKHPSAVTACNLDLENLVTDSNRSIATLAITTLLKTGSESSIDRLMKQISSFMSEISDEFKVLGGSGAPTVSSQQGALGLLSMTPSPWAGIDLRGWSGLRTRQRSPQSPHTGASGDAHSPASRPLSIPFLWTARWQGLAQGLE